jgi:hypothetical protein
MSLVAATSAVSPELMPPAARHRMLSAGVCGRRTASRPVPDGGGVRPSWAAAGGGSSRRGGQVMAVGVSNGYAGAQQVRRVYDGSEQ